MTKIISEIGWNHMGDMVLAKEMKPLSQTSWVGPMTPSKSSFGENEKNNYIASLVRKKASLCFQGSKSFSNKPTRNPFGFALVLPPKKRMFFSP